MDKYDEMARDLCGCEKETPLVCPMGDSMRCSRIAASLRSAVAEEREACAAQIEAMAANYPPEVFPDHGTSRDAISGSMARHCARIWARAIREREPK